jgi:hypothetical protein
MNRLPLIIVLIMYVSSVAHWITGLVPWVQTGNVLELFAGSGEIGLSVTLSITVGIKLRAPGSS